MRPAAELKTGEQTAWKESPANCYGPQNGKEWP